MGRVGASSDVFRAIADPTRRAVLDLLLKAERSVGDLSEKFEISQPALSQHLRVLREANLVKARWAGRERFYRLNPKPVAVVYQWAAPYRVLVDPAGHLWGLRSARSIVPSRRS
jgi:DNA-binding transcriptional ArsR family regulator